MMEDSRMEGRKEGLKEGLKEGRIKERTELADEIRKPRASGMPADQILQKIEQSVNRNARTRKKA